MRPRQNRFLIFSRTLNLNSAVATARNLRAEPKSHAEAQRRGGIESLVEWFEENGFHPTGEVSSL